MTLKTISWLLIGLLSLASIGAFAQKPFQQERRLKFPGWVSEKGYWVVESNINTPLDHVVSFYDNDNTLVYKETLKGIKINPEKRRVKMKLKKILEAAVLAYETKKTKPKPGEETALVRSVFQ
jgi:hypothetical protein